MKISISNLHEVRAALRDFKRNIEKNIVNDWFELGLKTITEARSHADFKNWSNNLRSSFGVAISRNGKILKHSYEIKGDGSLGDGKEGFEAAKTLTEEIAEEFPNSTVLILVAAEGYAGYVEKAGRNVLSGFVSSSFTNKLKIIDTNYGRRS